MRWKTGLVWLFAGAVCFVSAILAATKMPQGSVWYGAIFVGAIWMARGVWILTHPKPPSSS